MTALTTLIPTQTIRFGSVFRNSRFLSVYNSCGKLSMMAFPQSSGFGMETTIGIPPTLGYEPTRANDAEEAEAIVVIRGMQVTHQIGLERILILKDCRRLVRAFETGSDDLSWGALTLAPDMLAASTHFLDFRFSFIPRSLGSLEVSRLRISLNTTKCNGYGGGALGSQMNLFDRFARVIKSYANALVSTFEDPEKILEQTVLEMNDDLTKMRQATAQVLASQKRLENQYKAAEQASVDWYRRAQLALEKGDENLAREALKRRKSYADNSSALKGQLDQQRGVVENLVSNTRLLESKIQEAKSKKDTLKARAQSAKTATKVSEMLGNVNTSSALSAFEKMEEKVMAMESQAEALGQLTSDDLEGKFAMLESSSVDGDLASLKKELSGTSKKGELPPGRTAVSSSNTAFPFRDSEIEKELNELRSRAKDF
ncbi:hypothetical protein GIB67_042967 [Kingdonia uniflora]|uniref:RNase H type-1 domain-containing protein n=1 Tax=Kingdonia uniflora TaxID=39325 RepID=A0A7J7L649_9MAGN|nr:hypothetical protein GIB67_042967 [Kingdonia uniflora]